MRIHQRHRPLHRPMIHAMPLPRFHVVSGHQALELSGLGFSLNPAKVAKRHISMIRKAVKRHVALTKKMVKRHVGLVRRPFSDIRKMRTGSGPKRAAVPGSSEPIQYTDEAGNPIPASELYQYTDDAGNPLGPAPAGFDDYGYSLPTFDQGVDPYYQEQAPAGFYDSSGNAIDPRVLMTLPAARIRELAEAGALYPGSGETANALLERERMLYQSPWMQPPISYDDVTFPSFEPAPDRTVYGVEHTPTNYAALAPPYYGPQSPYAPYMSETEETAWSDRDAIYPGSSDDEWRANIGPSFAEDAYGADSLSGVYDVLIGDPIKFWTGKWQEAKGKLSAAVVSISGTSEQLASIRATIDSAIDATSNSTTISADGIASIERLRQKLVALEANQAVLEGKAKSAALQIQQTANDNPDSGLGIFPIVAVGVIVAAIIGIVGAVIVHTQNVNALANEVAAVMAGKISAADIAKIQGAGGPPGILPGFGLPDLSSAASSLAILAVIGIGAYFLLGRKR